ncbi:hypothetical protein FRC08_016756 [Ceratobasidium sp. 394]|nr:hypothetical protein FRC08_016756 [Ceratobasidium sp. 394]
MPSYLPPLSTYIPLPAHTPVPVPAPTPVPAPAFTPVSAPANHPTMIEPMPTHTPNLAVAQMHTPVPTPVPTLPYNPVLRSAAVPTSSCASTPIRAPVTNLAQISMHAPMPVPARNPILASVVSAPSQPTPATGSAHMLVHSSTPGPTPNPTTLAPAPPFAAVPAHGFDHVPSPVPTPTPLPTPARALPLAPSPAPLFPNRPAAAPTTLSNQAPGSTARSVSYGSSVFSEADSRPTNPNDGYESDVDKELAEALGLGLEDTGFQSTDRLSPRVNRTSDQPRQKKHPTRQKSEPDNGKWLGGPGGELKFNSKPEGLGEYIHRWSYSEKGPCSVSGRFAGDVHFSPAEDPSPNNTGFQSWVCVLSPSGVIEWAEFLAGHPHPRFKGFVFKPAQSPRTAPRWVKENSYKSVTNRSPRG